MTDALRTAASKLRRARRLVVRAELTLSALQATFWIALAVVSLGAVLILRRRIKPTAPHVAHESADVAQANPPSAQAAR
jgi:hypothetical protein